MSSVFSLLRGKATMCESILKICIFTFFSDIAYETLLCRGFKQKKKQETLRVVTIAMICSTSASP